MPPHVSVIGDLAGLRDLRNEWDEILSLSSYTNPFLSFAWVESWLRSFSNEYERPVVLYLHDSSRYRGFLPLILHKTRSAGVPIRSLELAGSHEAVYKGPIAVGDQEAFARQAIRFLLTEVEGWDTLVLDSVADPEWLSCFTHASEAESIRFRRHPLRTAPCMALPGDYETLRQRAKKSLRHNLKRRQNNAARRGVVIERISGDAVRPDHIYEAREVERRSWKKKVGVGIFLDDAHLNLHLGLLKSEKPFALDLLFLRIDGAAVAFQYGFTQRNSYYAYNTSYDEEFQSLSPGLLMTNSLLTELIPAGVGVFDFLVGDDSYKKDWTSDVRDIEGITAYRSSLIGRIACDMQRVRTPLRRAIRVLAGR